MFSRSCRSCVLGSEIPVQYREGEAMVKTKVKTEDEPGMEVDAVMEMEAGGDKVEFFMA